MLDPNWTPEAGYSHAANLLAIIQRQEQEGVDDNGDHHLEADSRGDDRS